MSDILRTPESQFDNLPDYPFEAKYINVSDDLRMHYVDEGNANDPIVLMLHGEPSWSYLYRKMIPVLVKNGFRAIAPDLIGFGKSDKPADKSAYTYQTHLNWLTTFVKKLDLNNILLFCQDWGGLLGLRMLTQMGDRFSMVVASNTFLPSGNVPMNDAFLQWREFSQNSPKFDIGKVIDMGTSIPLSEDIIAAYNAPFPSEEYKAGARMFPALVPADANDPEAQNNKEAWQILKQWNKPFVTIFGEKDFIMKGADQVLQKLIPGTKGQNHTTLDAGHFIQEEKGEELADLITAFYQKNR